MLNQSRSLFSRLALVSAALGLTVSLAFAKTEVPTIASGTNSDFLPAIELAPFVVEGEDLSISIHARSKTDRRYAEKFSEEVVAVAYDTIGKSTGRGLIIVGDDHEPHPLYVFRKFIAMAGAGQLQPEIAERTPEVQAILTEWEEKVDIEDEEGGPPITFEMIVKALPIPLQGLGSQLYQIAWLERFDVEKVELKFHSLTPADFADDRLKQFHWVFYLPPKRAFDQVLKDVVPLILESEEVGFFGRAAIRSAMVVFKPAIRKAVEGARKGMLFMTVLSERSDYSEDDVKALTGAYAQVLMPDFKFNGSSERERALISIEKQKVKNAEYAQDPFVTPDRLTHFDASDYAAFVGDYTDEIEAKNPETTHRFQIEGDHFTWQYRETPPLVFYPAGEQRFVIEDGKMTIEFLTDETGQITGVEERWKRRRKTVNRKS
jgi:hypothetical protein